MGGEASPYTDTGSGKPCNWYIKSSYLHILSVLSKTFLTFSLYTKNRAIYCEGQKLKTILLKNILQGAKIKRITWRMFCSHSNNYLPTYLRTYVRTYLPTYLPPCLPTYLPTYLPPGRPTNWPTDRPTDQPTYLLYIYTHIIHT